jgi:hypothetical protein
MTVNRQAAATISCKLQLFPASSTYSKHTFEYACRQFDELQGGLNSVTQTSNCCNAILQAQDVIPLRFLVCLQAVG